MKASPHLWLLIILLVTLPTVIEGIGLSLSPAKVSVGLRGSWNGQFPVAFHGFQYIQDDRKYFEMIQDVMTSFVEKTDEHFIFLDFISEHLDISPDKIELIKLLMDSEYYSVRLKAIRGTLGSKAQWPECLPFVQYRGSFFCNETALEKEFLSDKSVDYSHSRRFSFENGIFGGGEDIFLYGNPVGSQWRSFWLFFKFLKENAFENNLNVFLRTVHNEESVEENKPFLSGYGVELIPKSKEYLTSNVENESSFSFDSEYEVEKMSENEEENGSDSLFDFDKFLTNLKTMKPLRESEIANLDIQMAQLLVEASKKSSDNVNVIDLWKKMTNNFPLVASNLATLPLNSTFVEKDLVNRAEGQFLREQVSINGHEFFLDSMEDNMNIFSILNMLINDISEVDKMKSLFSGFNYKSLWDLLKSGSFVQTSKKVLPRFHCPNDLIFKMSDIEEDYAYSKWPASLSGLISFSFGMEFPRVRRNFLTVNLFFNPAKNAEEILFLFQFINRYNFPAQLNLIPIEFNIEDLDSDTSDPSLYLITKIMLAKSKENPRKLFNFLQAVSMKHMRSMNSRFSSVSRFISPNIIMESYKEFFPGSDIDISNDITEDYIKRLKIFLQSSHLYEVGELPVALVNGVPMSIASNPQASQLDGVQGLIMEASRQMNLARDLVSQGVLSDSIKNLPRWMMSNLEKDSQVFPKYNNYLMKESPRFVSIIKDEAFQLFSKNAPWFEVIDRKENQKVFDFSHIVCIDLNDSDLSSFGRMISSYRGDFSSRLSFSFLNKSSINASTAYILYLVAKSENISPYLRGLLLQKIFAEFDIFGDVSDLTKMISAFFDDHAIERDFDFVPFEENPSFWLWYFSSEKEFCTNLKAKAGLSDSKDSIIISNGRVISLEYAQWDLDLIELVEYSRVFKLSEEIGALSLDIIPSETVSMVVDTIWEKSDLLVAILSLFGEKEAMTQSHFRPQIPSIDSGGKKTIHLARGSGSGNRLTTYISGIVDPLSFGCRRLISIIDIIQQYFEVEISFDLRPSRELTKMPLNSFYQYFVNSHRQKCSGVEFEKMPSDNLFSLAMDVPKSWVVMPHIAVQDLDNIILPSNNNDEDMSSGDVHAEFILKNILVEGHAVEYDPISDKFHFDVSTRGIQLQLENLFSADNVHDNGIFRGSDTIVMSNFRYFQLKAIPGMWKLSLAPGSSEKMYTLVDESQLEVEVSEFISKPIELKLKRNKGFEFADVLKIDEDDDKNKGKESFASSFYQKIFPEDNVVNEPLETIHVFSVASGHLYERFVNIMMLSVVQQTNNPVKFWLIENFLSPQFKGFIEFFSQEFGFSYEFVSYKWPTWLNQQTEKQRMIWGYKILFLDVLFPLSVPKVIFIDADQVVRADLRELWDLDLKGRPYAYTPFCTGANRNNDTQGFRFWEIEDGYWQNHLRGKPYHISALSVTDLNMFRKIGAGDMLRATYESLSRDPESLSNLDQDLPNTMQDALPILSLPEEWLWCETWCNNDAKTRAKTIDLCNNPLTKTPKLDNAVRIIPEWQDLDNQVRQSRQRFFDR